MFKVEKKTLANGLRVLVVPMENSEAVTVQMLVNVGSKNEPKELSGISHFLEHLFFKGTKKRPNAGDIHGELDKIGASHNAFTDKEVTSYFVKSSYKDFKKSIDIISDMILNPIFNPEELEKERGVILQEINMYEDLPMEKVWDELEKLLYGDQPAGRPIAGSKETVSKISCSDVINYRSKNYLSKNMVLVVAGNVNSKEAWAEIKKYFSETKNGSVKPRPKTKYSQSQPAVKIIEKETDQSHIAMGFRAFDMFKSKRYAAKMLSVIVGASASSRLFTEVREKRGLAYYIGGGALLLTDYGTFNIRAGVAHEKVIETMEVIAEVLADINKNGITKEELINAKSFFRGHSATNLETSDRIADFYGEQELFYKKIEQPKEILKNIEKVTQGDILKVAREIFKPKNFNMAVIGKNKNTPENQELFKKIFSKI